MNLPFTYQLNFNQNENSKLSPIFKESRNNHYAFIDGINSYLFITSNFKLMKHTKGKWIVSVVNQPLGKIRQILYNLQEITVCDDIHCNETHYANAKLISKAPEMYEALKEMQIAFVWKDGNEIGKQEAFEKLESLLKSIES